MSKRILVIADMHVGSKYALMPRQFNGYLAQKAQLKILEEWNGMCKRERHIDYLIIDGDIVDGVARASDGKDVWTTDIDDQVTAASDLVKQIDYSKLLVAYGSPYHTAENLNADQVFAKQMNAVKHGYELSWKPDSCKDIIHISHMIGVSAASWQYRTTPLAKELVAALLNESALYKYRCIIRAHAHYYCTVAFSNFAFIVPCWQTRTPYMIRKGLSLVPKLGYVRLNVEDERLNHGGMEAHTFDMPRDQLVTE